MPVLAILLTPLRDHLCTPGLSVPGSASVASSWTVSVRKEQQPLHLNSCCSAAAWLIQGWDSRHATCQECQGQFLVITVFRFIQMFFMILVRREFHILLQYALSPTPFS